MSPGFPDTVLGRFRVSETQAWLDGTEFGAQDVSHFDPLIEQRLFRDNLPTSMSPSNESFLI